MLLWWWLDLVLLHLCEDEKIHTKTTLSCCLCAGSVAWPLSVSLFPPSVLLWWLWLILFYFSINGRFVSFSLFNFKFTNFNLLFQILCTWWFCNNWVVTSDFLPSGISWQLTNVNLISSLSRFVYHVELRMYGDSRSRLWYTNAEDFDGFRYIWKLVCDTSDVWGYYICMSQEILFGMI
jgi:hypothetical protein